ncbi:hypothetical protein L1987_20434 [Smallanthus sonchifolius]|uniref:Uncharacterized protein n=1 Tax=Smallanthus sonchifolius TaxID=185202 RepID=A0ACB9ISK0_9ASTR|nr:hypothetical protein L1987_20434 [Smallanthus sonchifolius]
MSTTPHQVPETTVPKLTGPHLPAATTDETATSFEKEVETKLSKGVTRAATGPIPFSSCHSQLLHNISSPLEGSTVRGSIRYPPRGTFNEAMFGQVHHPNWSIIQGSRLINLDVCREWLVKAIPPGESLSVQELSNAELSDHTATALATLSDREAHIVGLRLKGKMINGNEFDLQKARGELQEIADILRENQRKMNEVKLEFEPEKSAHASTKIALINKIDCLQVDKKWILENGFTFAHVASKLETGYTDKLYALTAAADDVGRLDGLREGHNLVLEGKPLPPPAGDVKVLLGHAYDALSDVDPEILDDIYDLADDDGIASLKTLLELFGAIEEDE